MGLRITVEQGDIADADVDAVVNAANPSLLGGGGVDGAIHRRGGPEILAACRELRAGRLEGGLPVGQAVATTAGNLRARWVIHTVGPVFSLAQDRTHLLASAFRECLHLADAIGAESVAFPAISGGTYRWPLDDVARVGIATLENTPTKVREARFVLFTPAALEVFAEALARRPR